MKIILISMTAILLATSQNASFAADPTKNEADIGVEKSKRRDCIDSGGTWISNKSGSYCLNKIKVEGTVYTNIRKANDQSSALPEESEKFDGIGVLSDPVAMGPRRRCVRNGGTFRESAYGYSCRYAKKE